MKQHEVTPKITYTIEVEIEERTEQEQDLNFNEVEQYLSKFLFHLRHRAIHLPEGEKETAIRISLIAFNPNN